MFKVPPKQHQDQKTWTRLIAESVVGIMNGKTNNVGTFTLTANQATSTITDKRLGEDSVILWVPMTANAAAEIGAGGMYVSTITAGTSFVITHANNAQTDRDFRYVIIG